MDDPRLGDIIQFGNEGDVVMLGFPSDTGVQRNGGRIGAKEGPAAVRRLMKRIGTVVNFEYGGDLNKIKIADAGDIENGVTLEEMHCALTSKVSSLISEGRIPFVIGGGNDQSYPNASGLLEQNSKEGRDVSVINIDAHLDVRPLKEGKVHSGSPFRLLLEDDRFNPHNFVEFASQGSQCSVSHVDYILKKGGRIVWLKELRECPSIVGHFEQILNQMKGDIFVSFDLDSVIGSDAPGVSCPGTVGLTSQEALQICLSAGKNPRVRLFDLSEYNPVIEEYRTGRLVANMFYFFALGLSQRNGKNDQNPIPIV